jgi:hypothetical protein
MPPIKVFARCASLCLLLLLCGAGAARAQVTQPCSKVNEIKDFSKISDMRDRLLLSISDLEEEIDTLKEKLPEGGTDAAQKELDNLQRGLQVIPKPRPGTDTQDEAANTSDVVKQRISILETQIRDFDANTAGIEEKQKQLDAGKIELECLQEKIRTLLTPEQDFKLTMSIYFAILVGLVIVGFFVLAFVDERVRRTIFSGEAGIQFLTLFSIVIAIILFGITGILQDKELAALLGGLSGYILGRSNNPDRKRSDEPERMPNDEPDETVTSPPGD